MTWYYRHGGEWVTATLKVREGDSWSPIAGGGWSGDVPWQDPPTRSNTIYTSDEGGLQAGLDALSSDTELIIDDGPYSGTYTHSTDHTTVSGGSGGATINLPSSESGPIINWPSASYTDVDVTAPISTGDTTIQVASTSEFSAGDDVRILDSTQVYQGLTRLGTSGEATTGEFQTIESVGSGEITLVESADRDYPDVNGALEVSRVDWAMEDIHYDNLTLSGYSTSDSGSRRPIEINNAFKNAWLTNINSDTWSYRGYDAHEAYNLYIDNMNVSNVGESGDGSANGITISVGTKNAVVRNTTVDGTSHYGINSGWDPTFNPAINHYYVDCTVTNADDAAYDQHNGSEDVHFIRCDGQSSSIGLKARGNGTIVQGGTWNSGYHGLQMTQKPENVHIKDLVIESSYRVFTFWPKEHYDIENFVVEDSQFTADDRLVWWRAPDDESQTYTANVEFRNCSINGEWVTDSHLTDTPQADSSWLNINATTSSPDDQTPEEYFG